MTVSALVTRNDITATASQTSFTYTFRVLEATDMDVYQNGALLASGYTVNDVGVTTGGTVTLDVGVPVGQIVSLVLAMPLDRTTNYQNSGDFLAGDVNGDFDKIYIGAIQNENEGGRSLRLQDVEPPTAGVDMTIPLKADRLGKFLAFDSVTGGPIAGSGAAFFDSAAWSVYDFTGDGSTVAFTLGSDPATENNTQVYIDGVYQEKNTYSVAGTVLTFSVAPLNLSTIEVMVVAILPIGSTLDQPTRADLVSYTPAGTGAVATTVQAKLRNAVSVKDFGALGNGFTDDTEAIQAALDASLTVHVPTGTYLVSTTLTFPSNQIIYGTGRQSIIKSTNTSGGICMQTDAIALGNLDNLTIRNLRITGAGSSSGGGAGLWLNDATRWYLEDVLIDQHGGIGLIVQDWSWIGEAHHCGFVNNGSHGVQTLMPEVSGAVFSLEFVSCMASGNGGNGYNINDSPTTDGNVFNIIGGSIEQNVVGVKIQRTRAISIDGVYFESNSAKAIEITGMASLGTAMIRNIGGGGLTEIFVDSGSVVIDGVMVYEAGQVIHITSESNYDVKNFILSPSDTLDPPYIKEIGSRNRGINASGNLLRNGNFIGWLWEQDQPSQWSTLGTATYARSTPPTGCSGDAMTITAGGTIAGVQQIISNLAVGSVVTVSAWIKASSGDTAVLKLVDNGEGQVRVLEVTSTDWKRYTIQHLLSDGSSALTVQLYGKANTDIGYFAEIQSTTHTDLKGWLSNPLDIREIAISNTVQNLDQGATPIVEGVTLCKTMDTVTVTDMLNGVVGQEITILFEHSKTITDNANLILSGGANFSGTANDTLTLIQKADGNWYEKSRSVN